MIDYLLAFSSAAAAQADSAAGAYYDTTDGVWRGDCVIPNVQVWDTRQNVASQSTDINGNPITSETPTYQPGFWLVISVPARVSALDTSTATQLVTDRDAANAGNPNFVLQSAQPVANLQYFMVSPTFAGSNYPFGKPVSGG